MARLKGAAALPDERATSAGGILFRQTGQGTELLLGKRRRERSSPTWSLPKGTPEMGESTEETALREVSEETGLEVRILATVGDIHYRFVREGRRIDKTVHYFLMQEVGGDLADHDHEFEEVRWMPLAEADRLMSFATERDIVTRALPVAGLE